MKELNPGVVLKCKKNLYKSTYKKFAFVKDKEYAILTVDETFVYIVDEEKNTFNFFRDGYSTDDSFGYYHLTEYFEMENIAPNTNHPVEKSAKQLYINNNFNFLGKIFFYLGMIRIRFHKLENGRIRGEEKIVIWNPLVLVAIIVASFVVAIIAFIKFWGGLKHELRLRKREN